MRSLIVAFLFLTSTVSFGQMLANPTVVAEKGKVVGGGAFSLSTTEYDFESFDEDIKRKILAGELGFGLIPGMDLFGQLGLVFDAEFDDSDYEGKGFIIGFGPRFAVHQTSSVKITAYGLINFTVEEYKGKSGITDVKCDLDLTDLHVGGMTSFTASESIKPYGGIELIVSSDGDAKCKRKNGGASLTSKSDAERDNQLNLHAGVNISTGAGFLVRPALILAGETTFVFSALASF